MKQTSTHINRFLIFIVIGKGVDKPIDKVGGIAVVPQSKFRLGQGKKGFRIDGFEGRFRENLTENV